MSGSSAEERNRRVFLFRMRNSKWGIWNVNTLPPGAAEMRAPKGATRGSDAANGDWRLEKLL